MAAIIINAGFVLATKCNGIFPLTMRLAKFTNFSVDELKYASIKFLKKALTVQFMEKFIEFWNNDNVLTNFHLFIINHVLKLNCKLMTC